MQGPEKDVLKSYRFHYKKYALSNLELPSNTTTINQDIFHLFQKKTMYYLPRFANGIPVLTLPWVLGCKKILFGIKLN